MMQMAFSYFPQKVLLGFALMHSHRKNSLLSNIMHSYVLSGLMAKACKKLKYNSNFFFGAKIIFKSFYYASRKNTDVDFMQVS